MIQDRIQKLETILQTAAGLPETTRAQLQQALDELKAELQPLSEERSGLVASVEGLESSHPHLVAAVNRVATILSNMGI
jgi:FtsZ-binding cell division protein ZapB